MQVLVCAVPVSLHSWKRRRACARVRLGIGSKVEAMHSITWKRYADLPADVMLAASLIRPRYSIWFAAARAGHFLFSFRSRSIQAWSVGKRHKHVTLLGAMMDFTSRGCYS